MSLEEQQQIPEVAVVNRSTTKKPKASKKTISPTKQQSTINEKYNDDALFEQYANSRVFSSSLSEQQNDDSETRVLLHSDIQIKNKLATNNSKLVSYVIDKNYSKQVTDSNKEDLFQEGMIGLLDAIDRFEPSLGYRFSTYAVWYIRQSIINYLKANHHLVHVPSHIMNQYSKSNKELKLQNKNIIENIEEFSPKDLGVTEKMHHCLSMMRGMNTKAVSLDSSEQQSQTSDNSGGCYTNNKLTKATTIDSDQELRLFSEEMRKATERSLDVLTERERDVLLLRFTATKQTEEILQGKRYPASNKKGRYVTITDGLDYRTIAKIMREKGWQMNHATARNVLVSGYTKFFDSFINELGLFVFTKQEVQDLSKNQAIHDILPDILYIYKPFETRYNIEDTKKVETENVI